MNKPFSQACENNKDPILAVLKRVFINPCEVLEIGSGTGQHAVYFAECLPHLIWQPSDQAIHLPGIDLWIDEARLENIKLAMTLDINQQPWSVTDIEAVFTANTLHIISWENVQIFIQSLGETMRTGAKFCCYGPFNIGGTYTSESNARFDIWLKEQDPGSAIRDLEAVVSLADDAGLKLLENIEMPANNKLLVLEKI
ncbi:MAG: methylase [Gammaproteobacteria bacterium]|nr:MAG: methylase [Gammaproteobacteria bacterium]